MLRKTLAAALFSSSLWFERIYIYMRYILTKKKLKYSRLPRSGTRCTLTFHTRVAHLTPLSHITYIVAHSTFADLSAGCTRPTHKQKKGGMDAPRSPIYRRRTRKRPHTQIHRSGWYHPSHRALASDRNGEKRASRNTSYTRCRCH